MPMASVRLRPGINTLMTPSQNEAGVSQSQLVRYQQGMIQKYGGWTRFFPGTIGSTVRDLLGWQGITGNDYLGVGATESLSVVVNNSNQDITPQTLVFDVPPNFSVSSGSNIVTVQASGSSASVYTSVYFNTPVAVGDLLLNGRYQVDSVIASSSFTILSSNIASTTVTSSGILPIFTTIGNSFIVSVDLPNNNFQVIPGQFQQFIAPTSVGGLTIQGPYQVNSVIDSTEFEIGAPSQASSGAIVTMNNGNAQLELSYQIGPPLLGGYGSSGYGSGGYGTGSASPSASGDPITATDWTLANWGEFFLACPYGGPIYGWYPSGGFQNAGVISGAPSFNGGIFVAMPQQILVAWGSVQSTGVQDPLAVRWSDQEDYSNWAVTSQTEAGSFHIPTGSVIRGGMQAPTQGLIWTDLSCWVMRYVGRPAIFNFTEIGTGCGLVGPHAMGKLGGNVYWMGPNNFHILSGNGVQPIPCSIWNFVFQNIDADNWHKVRCAPNSLFNEITWFFPAINGTGENSLYAKLNVAEGEWDYGSMDRSAWIDVTVLGNPVASDLSGVLYQHDTTNDANGSAMASSFQSGWWSISEGNDLAFVDWFLPDMTFSTYNVGSGGTANMAITLYAADYFGDTPRTYGPYSFTRATQFINTRLRGRVMSMKVESSDLGSFWRIGRIRYRYAVDGRR